ncbi:MAG: hypothetical protein EBU27_08535, partial [Opitutae bacterium]|nr:hypothetical protein [Opitutae bacterium]
MGLNKKDRRISIWIGVIIGVTISSLLFRYAINDKNERASKRPGSYESNMTAVGYHTFPGIPNSIRDAIPHGLVLHYESNFSVLEETSSRNVCWVIESGHPESNCIVSCGGGLCMIHGMLEVLREKGFVICLWADAEVIFER